MKKDRRRDYRESIMYLRGRECFKDGEKMMGRIKDGGGLTVVKEWGTRLWFRTYF